MWKIKKKWIFSKNWLTLFVSGREKKRAFSCTLPVLTKNFFGPKQCKPGKTIKIAVSAEIAQNQKWHLFWKKVFFDMGEKVGFTNCVFEKLCFPENTIFIVFSAKHSFSKTKTVCWKNRKFMKNSGLFLNMANGVFWVWFFWGSNIKKVCFWCVWHCFKSVKNACFFPSFGGFSGWLIIVHLGLEGLGVFCVCFSLLCCFCFCFVCLVIGFVVVLFFVLFVCFFVLLFGGFKGQERWPKWPPHLALNPPYFLVLVFCLFLFFWRV